MKKFALLLLLMGSSMLIGCSQGYNSYLNPMWDDYYYDMPAGHAIFPEHSRSNTRRRVWKQPRKYVVTKHDEKKYDDTTARVQKRLDAINKKKIAKGETSAVANNSLEE